MPPVFVLYLPAARQNASLVLQCGPGWSLGHFAQRCNHFPLHHTGPLFVPALHPWRLLPLPGWCSDGCPAAVAHILPARLLSDLHLHGCLFPQNEHWRPVPLIVNRHPPWLLPPLLVVHDILYRPVLPAYHPVSPVDVR